MVRETRSITHVLPVQSTYEHQVTHEDAPYPDVSPEDLLHPPDFRPFFTLVEDPETGENHHPSIHYIFSDDDADFLTSALIDNHSLHTDHPQTSLDAERLILLDVAADGKSISNAQSLSPDWQVAMAAVTQAPSWNETDQNKREGCLMLTISGTESHGRPNYPATKSSQDGIIGRVESVMAGYHDRLAALDRLIKRDAADQNVQSNDDAGIERDEY